MQRHFKPNPYCDFKDDRERRLPMAQQRQGRCGEVQAIATLATSLACFIFRFLRRPQYTCLCERYRHHQKNGF